MQLKKSLFNLTLGFGAAVSLSNIVAFIPHVVQAQNLAVDKVAYNYNLQKITDDKTIVLVPGHNIQPGSTTGTRGEAEFNLRIVNSLQQKLEATGWRVIRPDVYPLRSRFKTWPEYLQKIRVRNPDIPWIEVHGQGSPLPLGVIADKNNKYAHALAQHFGWYSLEGTGRSLRWYGVTTNRQVGGIPGMIIEAHNTDKEIIKSEEEQVKKVEDIASRMAKALNSAVVFNNQR